MHLSRPFSFVFAITVATVFLGGNIQAQEKTVNIYSSRIEKLMKPTLDLFTQSTGIATKVLYASEAELLERIRAEGDLSPADLLITVDSISLGQAVQMELLQPIQSTVLKANVPENLRHPQMLWVGLTLRARSIIYNNTKVKTAELSTYEQLGEPAWKNRLCLRTSKKIYTQALIASMIATQGTEKTTTTIKAWLGNDPLILDSDDKIIDTIASGKCDVGIINTYYLARKLKVDSTLPVSMFWANQKDRGVHVNISGGGLAKSAKNVKEAVSLLEFLSSEKAQNLFVDDNMEYPINPQVAPSANLEKLIGKPSKIDAVNLSSLVTHHKAAIELMENLGYK